MILPYNTVVIYETRWADGVKELLQAQLAQMVADGKTDGLGTVDNPNGVELPPQINTRNWTTYAAAEEWGNFVVQTTPATFTIGGPTQ
mgnify:CR=1 FL=1